MTKALFKKQMMEVFSWIYQDKKSGKNRSLRGIVAYVVLYLLIFGFLGYIFYNVADMLCAPLVSANLGWLFFAIMGLISTMLGVFGSVFNTFSSVYQAKDNNFLLSMPISPPVILTVRLSGVFAMGLMYELIVMIPTLIVYFMNAPLSISSIIFTLLIPFVLAVFVLTLSCILGWVVALVSGRLKNKSIVTVILSLAFVAVYYYCYARAYSILQRILADPWSVGDKVKSILYPFYHMGLAAGGKAVSMLIFTAVIAVLFGIVYLVLSCSFMKLATTNRGSAKVKYKEKNLKAGNIESALLRKELKRFLGSSVYMLNCGLGTLMLIIAAVMVLIKGAAMQDFLGKFDRTGAFIPLLASAALCMLTAMNDITAPSVSLEGKNLWLVQSLPVSSWQVLKAKLKLHLILTEIPTLLCAVCVTAVLRPDFFSGVMIVLLPILFVLFSASFGLAVNLKTPNLNWTNETVPVKQSFGTILAMLGEWVLVVALGGVYIAVRSFINPDLYLLLCTVMIAVASVLLLVWLKKRGTRIFEEL